MSKFSTRLIKWHKAKGRKNLPWQKKRTPYKVWISEIMLQQTQVSTATPYFERFIKEFPNIKKLAEANLDQVMSHWSGLGYYARARNIYEAAKIISSKHKGKNSQLFGGIIVLTWHRQINCRSNSCAGL